MMANSRLRRWATVGGGTLLAAGLAILVFGSSGADASPPWRFWRDRRVAGCNDCDNQPSDVGGYWLWMRSPDEEKQVVMGLYNRYCIRCHGVDGRGIWDIPGVPDFTNVRWQASRPNDHIARIVIEGRGAVMPPFRGTLSYEEAAAMARYLRTFVPGTEVHRPDLTTPEKKGQTLELPREKKGL